MRLSDAKTIKIFCFFSFINVVRVLFYFMFYEFQKLITSIVLVVLLVIGIAKLSNSVFETEKNVVAYKVEIQEKVSETEEVQELDLKAFFALGTVDHGKKVFKKCAACHSINEGGKHKIGPALWGVMSRNSGEISDYKYSKSLIAHNKNWSFNELNGFLLKPATWIKGNKMGFAGLKDDKDRASVILYLNESSNEPLPLP